MFSYTHFPNRLETYDTKSTKILFAPDWDTHSPDFEKIAKAMLESIRFVHYGLQNPKKVKANEVTVCLSFLEEFINCLVHKIETHKGTVDPRTGFWENNWFTFAIPICSFLGQYLLLNNAHYDKIRISNVILEIIITPCKALNCKRDTYEARMLEPWILAKYFKGEIADAIKNPDYLKARNTVLAKFKTETNATVLHMDMSWLSYNLISAYDSLRDSVSEKALYYFYLDEWLFQLPTLNYIYIIALRIVVHPTIPLGNIGMFGRKETNYSPIYDKAELGIYVQPLSRFIRFNTEQSQFSVRAQSMHLAFAQLSQQTEHTGKFWVQYPSLPGQ